MKLYLQIVFLFASSFAFAQYDAAVGLKANHYKIGLAGKFFISDSSAIDTEFDFQVYNGVEFIGLYVWQRPFEKVENLYWYCGLGVNAGRWNEDYGEIIRLSAGIDAQVGIEYISASAPLVFSFDYTPNFSFSRSRLKSLGIISYHRNPWIYNWAIGVKYCFE